MQYFALLISREPNLTPDERGEVMTAFENFHAKAGSAIRVGDALLPAATGVRITGGPDAPVITDGPFAEAAEVACGYYVFEADNLDEALARDVPVAQYGAVVVWPTVHSFEPSAHRRSRRPATTGTEWDAWRPEFGPSWAHLSAAPHTDPDHVRVRDGEVLTDGPYAEGAEVANGFYVLGAADRDEASSAAMIPASAVELRHLAGVSGL